MSAQGAHTLVRPNWPRNEKRAHTLVRPYRTLNDEPVSQHETGFFDSY